MTNTQDVKTLLGSLLRVNQVETASEGDHSTKTSSDFDDDSLLSNSELYRDEQGNLLPSKLHVVPLFGRPVMPSQITTVQLNLEWIDVITEVIASQHHTFAMFAVSNDKLKQRKISLKDFPKTGTVVRLLSARTGPDEIDIICEGIRRVSLLDVADIKMNLARVRYPEIEYRLANPTFRDKLNSNALALRESFERANEFEKKFKKLRNEMEQYARSIGVRVVVKPMQHDPDFFLIYNKHQVGRISLGKLNTLLDFVNVKLNDEQKLQLATMLARPTEDEYSRLKKYINQLHKLADRHRDKLSQDLERISPKTKALADSFLDMLNQQQSAKDKTSNDAQASGTKVVDAKVIDPEGTSISLAHASGTTSGEAGAAGVAGADATGADSKAHDAKDAAAPSTIATVSISATLPEGMTPEAAANSGDLTIGDVTAKLSAVDANGEEQQVIDLGSIFMTSEADLEDTIAAAMQKMSETLSKDATSETPAPVENIEQELKSVYKTRVNQQATTTIDESMLAKLQLTDDSYTNKDESSEANGTLNFNDFLSKIDGLLQDVSNETRSHATSFKLRSMGSTYGMSDMFGDSEDASDLSPELMPAKMKTQSAGADGAAGSDNKAGADGQAETISSHGVAQADSAHGSEAHDAETNGADESTVASHGEDDSSKDKYTSKDLFALFSLLNEVGASEEQEMQEEQNQIKQHAIDSIIGSVPKDDDDDKAVAGPNFGFVNEDTSVVTFMPGQDSSENLLLKLTQLQKEQEQQFKDKAAAMRASEASQQIIDELNGKKAQASDKGSLGKAGLGKGSKDSQGHKGKTSGIDDVASKEDTKIRVIDASSNPDEVTAEILSDDGLSEKELAQELSSLFSILGDDKDASVDKSSKWASLQRAAMIRTKIAELLGGKVVFGVSTLNEKQKGAQREVEARAYCLGITAALQELLPLNPLITDEMQQYLSRSDMSNPSVLADCAASITQSKPSELQQVLDTIPILPRLKIAFELISRELSAAKLQDKIKVSVAEKIQKRQKEFFLKEQLNEIKSELGLTADEKDLDVKKFSERMSKLDPPQHIKTRFDEELSKLSVLESASPEYGVTRNYLDIISSIPWGKMSKEKFNLARARKILDQDHEGLQDVKDRIIEFMAVGALKGQTRGQIMLFVGPPGVGKTSIGKSIAKALNRPFFRLSLGGIDDVSEIKGHRKTYVGAMPGKLVNALRETKVMNPVIMLDEIDKLGRSYHGDPDSALLETLDPEQNKNFLDVYLDEKLDLSNCLFICTANSTETISAPLLDRMDPIQLSGYIAKEKFAIAKKHLIPRAFDEAGIKDKRILQIPDVTLTTLIEGYARESGVRSLERAIAKLIRKAAVKLVEGTSKIVIKPEDLEDYLGTAPFKKEKMLQGVGIMTGLAWTASGGVTLPVESIVTSQDAAGFKLTGSLGDVMKESANIALSFVQSHLSSYTDKKGEQFFKKKTVHLHVPEGAIPKDGPSAGVTMATSLLSLALNKAPKQGFAMTGELTLTGHVLPIGGLREKVIAARRMGIFDLIIPIGNEGDVKELPEQVKNGITFYYADTYSDVAYVLFDDVKAKLEAQGYTAPRSYVFVDEKAEQAEQADKAQKAEKAAPAKKATKAKSSKGSSKGNKPSADGTKATKATKDTKSLTQDAKSTSQEAKASKNAVQGSKDAKATKSSAQAKKAAPTTAQDEALDSTEAKDKTSEASTKTSKSTAKRSTSTAKGSTKSSQRTKSTTATTKAATKAPTSKAKTTEGKAQVKALESKAEVKAKAESKTPAKSTKTKVTATKSQEAKAPEVDVKEAKETTATTITPAKKATATKKGSVAKKTTAPKKAPAAKKATETESSTDSKSKRTKK